MRSKSHWPLSRVCVCVCVCVLVCVCVYDRKMFLTVVQTVEIPPPKEKTCIWNSFSSWAGFWKWWAKSWVLVAFCLSKRHAMFPSIHYSNICCTLCALCGEGNGNPLQYSCLENFMDRGAGWAIYRPWDHKESNTDSVILWANVR